MLNRQNRDAFGARSTLETREGRATIYRLNRLEESGVGAVSRLPHSIKILLESMLRNLDGELVTEDNVRALAAWKPNAAASGEIPFMPARVLMQDFTGVPAVVDLAAMRSALKRRGGDPSRVNPVIPVDLVIDHSVQVDVYGTQAALQQNSEIDFKRNRERYEFLRWGQKAFKNFRVVPPATGIVHQVNLEFLAPVVVRKQNTEWTVFPDSVLGMDSHTPMINGLGVLGWGVGGIEAEAAMLGQPYYMLAPEVVGIKLGGQLREGVTATDLVLTVTEMLRKEGVVEKFVEFYGNGLSHISLPDRATVGNMAPDYGATVGFFPVDAETLRYLRMTGRSEEHIERVERYTKEQGLFRTDETPHPEFSKTLEFDLGSVESSLAGPKRPQDRIPLSGVKISFQHLLQAPVQEQGFGLRQEAASRAVTLSSNGDGFQLRNGSVVIAAITSCTNTSNPSVMVGAGLLAKKAVEHGLKVPRYVKTSLAPGSKAVTEYLRKSELLGSLEQLGFDLVGYGCTTCIGNSGPLEEEIDRAVRENQLVVAAVLSGNRNFEGRVHPAVKANYLASPPLVVAYALAGGVDVNLVSEPLGNDPNGRPVYLRDIWPSQQEVDETISQAITPDTFRSTYANVWDGNSTWNAVRVMGGELYEWRSDSTYVREPSFFSESAEGKIPDIRGARVLALLGDSITTDHISPAGDIPLDSPAGRYLTENGIQKKDFNSYGSRRGNHEVMVRGAFAHIRLRNLVAPGTEGGVTTHFPSGERMSIYDAAMRYAAAEVPLVVIGGKEYGSGSSRDWAAKGPALLGVRAVLVESFERIHRGNLVGMGVLPLQFHAGESAASLGLTGEELIDIEGLSSGIQPRQELTVTATSPNGARKTFLAIARLNSAVEVDYYNSGGILHAVLKKMERPQ